MHYEGCFGKAIAFSIGYYAFSMVYWVKTVPRIVPQCNSRQNRPSLPRNLSKWPMYKVIITDSQNLIQFDSHRPYRPFWHDVTSAMFASQNNKTACMLVFQTVSNQAMCALGLRCIVDVEFSRWRWRSRNFPGYMLYISIDIVLFWENQTKPIPW